MHQIFIFIVLLALLTGVSAAQQDTLAPVFIPLNAIPDMPSSRNIVTLVDRTAISAAYPGAAAPADVSALLQALSRRSASPTSERAWVQVLSRLNDETGRSVIAAEGAPTGLGIDFMEIDQVGTFGTPPENGLILQGAFDIAAVESALSEREYQPVDGLWCFQSDCANGTMINFDQRNPANPFGGELGRTQPLLLTDSLLMSSALDEIVTASQQVLTNADGSLASDPVYRAASIALSQQGVVLQVTFIGGESLQTSSEAALENPPDGIAPIAPYMLYAIADVASETEQIGIAAFVFQAESDAAAAVKQMSTRLSLMSSLAANRPWQELLTSRNITITADVLPVDGLYVAVLRFSTPLATVEELLEATSEDAAGRQLPAAVYSFLFRGLSNRDDQWRWWQSTSS